MRRKAYSGRRLVAKDFEKIITSLGSAAVVMGVDVAKRELVLMLRCSAEQFFGPYRAANPEQIREVVEVVRLIGARGPVKVALEPSGTYGDAFRQALSDAGGSFSGWNPSSRAIMRRCSTGFPRSTMAKTLRWSWSCVPSGSRAAGNTN
jgi:hypothetical protein